MKRYWVRAEGGELEIGVAEVEDGLRVVAAGAAHRVAVTQIVPGAYTLIVDGRCHDLLVWDGPGGRTLTLDGAAYTAATARAPERRGIAGTEPARAAEIRAPMPGLLVAVPVEPGARVGMGEAVAIMEAMKMQMEIRAPHAGTIMHVHARAGQELTAGQLLVTLE